MQARPDSVCTSLEWQVNLRGTATSCAGPTQCIIRCRLQEARGLKFEDPEKRAAFEKWDLDELGREIAETQASCERLASPVVCSHNDLLSGNIMIPHSAGRVRQEGRSACLPGCMPGRAALPMAGLWRL